MRTKSRFTRSYINPISSYHLSRWPNVDTKLIQVVENGRAAAKMPQSIDIEMISIEDNLTLTSQPDSNELLSMDSVSSVYGGGTYPQNSQADIWPDVSTLSDLDEEKCAKSNTQAVHQNFQIIQLLGEGSYAKVYLCDYPDKSVTQYAAVKCSKKPDSLLDSTQCEYEDDGAPGHVTYELIVYMKLWNSSQPCKSIPYIYDYGELDNDHSYMAMQLLGPSWDTLIESADFSNSYIANYIEQLINCLETVHKNDIVHCDIKPKNILAKSNSCLNEVFLIDFGLAFHIGSSKGSHHCQFMGTPDYSSDDRLSVTRSPKPIDDMVGLGFCALHAWLGDLPWRFEPEFSYGKFSKASLTHFQNERTYLMKQGLASWPPFFKEWFALCDAILLSNGEIPYNDFRKIASKNRESLVRYSKLMHSSGELTVSSSDMEYEPMAKRGRYAS